MRTGQVVIFHITFGIIYHLHLPYLHNPTILKLVLPESHYLNTQIGCFIKVNIKVSKCGTPFINQVVGQAGLHFMVTESYSYHSSNTYVYSFSHMLHGGTLSFSGIERAVMFERVLFSLSVVNLECM
jgi:hypothetical protein|uniref:Uncharacterized protein n=1 Tax=Picea glauca TaxID=3330 RepID=A0A101M1K8_PICGL|nr:hypothetical protein ABT39_MTgene3776 [Picea glauca]QHR86059.1 hypothetical protein Q903MT_gene57 [Picea sitchensis]